jgi:hypothetical protein
MSHACYKTEHLTRDYIEYTKFNHNEFNDVKRYYALVCPYCLELSYVANGLPYCPRHKYIEPKVIGKGEFGQCRRRVFTKEVPNV